MKNWSSFDSFDDANIKKYISFDSFHNTGLKKSEPPICHSP